jgi:hypothetical protein
VTALDTVRDFAARHGVPELAVRVWVAHGWDRRPESQMTSERMWLLLEDVRIRAGRIGLVRRVHIDAIDPWCRSHVIEVGVEEVDGVLYAVGIVDGLCGPVDAGAPQVVLDALERIGARLVAGFYRTRQGAGV